MRVLVVGGAGMLGQFLVPILEDMGHEVFICDNFSGAEKHRLPKGLKIFTADAALYNPFRPVFQKVSPDIVFIALGYNFDPTREWKYNFSEDTKIVLNSANTIGRVLTPSVKHVYFCSSSEVYGGPEPRAAIKESRNIKKAATHLGAAKLSAEQVLQFRCDELGIPLTILRLFDLYGPRIKFSGKNGIINFLIDTFLRNEQIGITGAKRKRDFLYVGDAAAACSLLIEADEPGIYNIGSGEGPRLVDTAKLVRKEVGSELPILMVPDRKLKTYSTVANISKLQKTINWAPETELEEYLPELIEFHKRELEISSNGLLQFNLMRAEANE